jgi:hypothetical protein
VRVRVRVWGWGGLVMRVLMLMWMLVLVLDGRQLVLVRDVVRHLRLAQRLGGRGVVERVRVRARVGRRRRRRRRRRRVAPSSVPTPPNTIPDTMTANTAPCSCRARRVPGMCVHRSVGCSASGVSSVGSVRFDYGRGRRYLSPRRGGGFLRRRGDAIVGAGSFLSNR